MVDVDCSLQALSALRQRVDLELTEEIEIGVADPADDPETALQVKLRGMLLRRALNRLSSQHRRSSTSSTIMRSRSPNAWKFWASYRHRKDPHVLRPQEAG